MSQHDSMIQVLAALMSADNSHRQQAESFFTMQLETSLLDTISNLLSILGAAEMDMTLRNMAGILLRRAIDPASSYGSLITHSDMQALRTSLMNIWAVETQPVLLKRLSHIIAQSAAAGQWGELIPQVIGHGQTQSGDALLAVLGLVEVLAEYCPDDTAANAQGLASLLGGVISDDSSPNNVQIACAKAIGACIVALEDDDSKELFKPAVQPVIRVLGGALTRGDEQDAAAVMEHLVEVAAQQPMFFKGGMDSVVSCMLTVVSSEGLEFSTRSIALELMVTLAETAPALARRCEGLIQGLVPLAMALMLDLDEDEESWARGPYSEQQALEDEDSAVGEEAIERVAAGLGGRCVGPHVVAAVLQFAASQDSAHRRAAVAALSRLAEGSSKVFQKSYLATTMQFLHSALRDPSPRVQYQALQAVGQLVLLYPDSAGALIDLTMPAALQHLSASGGACDRVKGHCLSALINLTNPAHSSHSAEQLQPHMDALLSSLCENLSSSSLEVQPVCLQLLGSVAQLAGEGFAPYYSAFMPGVKSIMRSALAPHLSTLRGKAMECVGLVGEAVGDEVFAQDAQEVMEILLGAMQRGQGDEDDVFDHILPACARISKTLGEGFRPFLPLVMTPLLAGAGQQINFSMVDAEEGDDEGENVYDEETGTESAVISLGSGVKKRVTLNTHAVQQKNQCGRMIYEFAANLKGHLREYLSPCLQATLPMVLDKHYSQIRSSASLALGKLFEAGLDGAVLGFLAASELQELLGAVLDQLLLAVKGEINASSRICAADALRDVIEACFLSGTEAVDGSRDGFKAMPSEEWSRSAAQHLMAKCQECVTRREGRVRAFQQNEGLEGEDEDALMEQLEEEEDLLATLVDAIGFLLKLHGEPFMQLVDIAVAPAFAPYLEPAQPAELRTVAVCMLDDIFEFGGAAALKYVPHCLPLFVNNFAEEEHPVLRQASVYGVAQILRFAPELCVQHLSVLAPALVQLASLERVSAEDDEEEGVGNEGIVENALYALGMMCHSPVLRESSWGGQVSISEVASLWLRALPFRADEAEARCASRQLCEAVERGDALVLGAEYENLPELLRVIAEVFQQQAEQQGGQEGGGSVHPETFQRLQGVVRRLQDGAVAPELLQAAFSALSAQQQASLQV